MGEVRRLVGASNFLGREDSFPGWSFPEDNFLVGNFTKSSFLRGDAIFLFSAFNFPFNKFVSVISYGKSLEINCFLFYYLVF